MNDEKVIPTQIRIPINTHTELKIEAAERRVSLEKTILEYILKGLKEKRVNIPSSSIAKGA